MKHSFIPSFVFALLALVVAAMSVGACFRGLHAPAQLLRQPEGATRSVTALAEAVSDGDAQAARKLLLGAPELNLDYRGGNPLEAMLWDAYLKNLSCSDAGLCYPTDTGLSLDVTFRVLDMDAVTELLGPASEQLLAQRLENAEDPDRFRDPNGGYREDFVQELLCTAAGQILSRELPMTEADLTVNLVYSDGQWLIQPDQRLVSVLSGNITD